MIENVLMNIYRTNPYTYFYERLKCKFLEGINKNEGNRKRMHGIGFRKRYLNTVLCLI